MSEKDRPKPPTGPTPDAASEADEAQARTADPTLEAVTGADVESAFRGQDFPAGARELVERARLNGAGESVLQRLADLPDRPYTSLGDALRALDMLS